MGHFHMRRQGLQSAKDNSPDTGLYNKITNNVVYFTTVDPSTTKEGKIYSYICGHFPTTSSKVYKYIYVMYVYGCNAILTASMNNISEEDIIRDFTSLTEDLKSRGIHPAFLFMGNEASTNLRLTMTTMNIKYQLVPPRNHRSNNAERSI